MQPLGYETRLVRGVRGAGRGVDGRPRGRAWAWSRPCCRPCAATPAAATCALCSASCGSCAATARTSSTPTPPKAGRSGASRRCSRSRASAPSVVHTFHGHSLTGYFSVAHVAGVHADRAHPRPAQRRPRRRLTRGARRPRADARRAARTRSSWSRSASTSRGSSTTADAQSAERPCAPSSASRPNEEVVTLVARLVPIKRVDRFLEVAARLADRPHVAVRRRRRRRAARGARLLPCRRGPRRPPGVGRLPPRHGGGLLRQRGGRAHVRQRGHPGEPDRGPGGRRAGRQHRCRRRARRPCSTARPACSPDPTTRRRWPTPSARCSTIPPSARDGRGRPGARCRDVRRREARRRPRPSLPRAAGAMTPVSVVIPVWDSYVRWLGEAVASVVGQDAGAELIVVDNASTVAVPEIAGTTRHPLRHAAHHRRRPQPRARHRQRPARRLPRRRRRDAAGIARGARRPASRPTAPPSPSSSDILEGDTGKRHRSPRPARARAGPRAARRSRSPTRCGRCSQRRARRSCARGRSATPAAMRTAPRARTGCSAAALAWRGRVRFGADPGLVYRWRWDSPGRVSSRAVLMQSARAVRSRLKQRAHPPWGAYAAIGGLQWTTITVVRPAFRHARRMLGG